MLETSNPLLDYRQAAEFLSKELGRAVTANMLRHARERDKSWPFFIDPLSKKIVIRQQALLGAWRHAEVAALTAAKAA